MARKCPFPLSNVGPRNQYKSNKATMQQIMLQLKQLEQNIMVEIDNAVKQAQSAYKSVKATRQARIYAEAALDAEQRKYAVGKSTTFTVLQLQNTLTARPRGRKSARWPITTRRLPIWPRRKAARSNATTLISRRSKKSVTASCS